VWVLDAAACRMPAPAEPRPPTAADATIDWAVVVEATRIEEAARIPEILSPDRAAAAGAEQAGPLETYRLLCSLSRGADGR
jgi:hypothetical protein